MHRKLFQYLTGALLVLCTPVIAQPPSGFSTLCTLDENCAVSQSTLIAFGVPDNLTYRTLVGNFICQAETFAAQAGKLEDPVCYALESTTASSASSIAAAAEQQKVTFPGDVAFAIISESSGKAISVLDHPEQANVGVVVQSDFVGREDQLWLIKRVAKNYYAITSLNAEVALAVSDWNLQEGAKLQTRDWINGWNQQWRLQPLQSGYFKLVSRFSQQAIDVYELNNFDNGEVRTWTYWGGENQHWRLIPIKAR